MITEKQAQRFLNDIQYGFAINNLMAEHSPKYDEVGSPLYNRLLELDELERKVTAMEKGIIDRNENIIQRYRTAMNEIVRECEQIIEKSKA